LQHESEAEYSLWQLRRIKVLKARFKLISSLKYSLKHIYFAALMVFSVSAGANDLSDVPRAVSKIAHQSNSARFDLLPLRSAATTAVVVKSGSGANSQASPAAIALFEAETWGMLLVGLGIISLRARGMKDRSKRVYI
jgi:hypothetical protein